jgi:hypothetical protein
LWKNHLGHNLLFLSKMLTFSNYYFTWNLYIFINGIHLSGTQICLINYLIRNYIFLCSLSYIECHELNVYIAPKFTFRCLYHCDGIWRWIRLWKWGLYKKTHQGNSLNLSSLCGVYFWIHGHILRMWIQPEMQMSSKAT